MEWLIIGCGVFSICGAVLDWEWFMNSRKAQFFVKIFGRTGARFFYGFLGAVIATIGALVVAGVIEKS